MSAIAQFVTYNGIRIQNLFNQSSPYTFEGNGYSFVPFVYKGAAVEANGENSEAFIAFSNTDMTLGIMGRNAINQMVSIVSVWLTTDLQINPAYPPRRDTLLINSVAFNEERVELRLRSAVDAAIARFPNRRITSGLVGNLPREGQVRIA